jgi:hypothetical protein
MKSAENIGMLERRASLLKQHPLFRHSHQWIDACDLAMSRRIAEKIRQRPELMEIAKENLSNWKKKVRPWPQALREWEQILSRNSQEQILAILTQDNDEGQRLRQSDPFIGILTEKERMWFLENYEPA